MRHLEGDCREAAQAGELGHIDQDRKGAGGDEDEDGCRHPLVLKYPAAAHVPIQQGAHQQQRPALYLHTSHRMLVSSV